MLFSYWNFDLSLVVNRLFNNRIKIIPTLNFNEYHKRTIAGSD